MVPILENLRKTGVHHLPDGVTLHANSLLPQPCARPGDACLLVWGDSEQAAAVEKAMESTGSLGIVPWVEVDIADWVADFDVPAINCRGLRG